MSVLITQRPCSVVGCGESSSLTSLSVELNIVSVKARWLCVSGHVSTVEVPAKYGQGLDDALTQVGVLQSPLERFNTCVVAPGCDFCQKTRPARSLGPYNYECSSCHRLARRDRCEEHKDNPVPCYQCWDDYHGEPKPMYRIV